MPFDSFRGFSPGASEILQLINRGHEATGEYLAWSDSRWQASANLPNLLRTLPVRALEPAALVDLALYGAILAPLTLYRGVWRLPGPTGRAISSPAQATRVKLVAASDQAEVITDDEVIRSLVDVNNWTSEPTSDPRLALVARIVATASREGPLLVDVPLGALTDGVAFLQSLRVSWRWRALRRASIVHKMRAAMLEIAPEGLTEQVITTRFLRPHWRRILQRFGQCADRSVGLWQDAAMDIPPARTLLVARAEFRPSRQDGLNLYSLAMDRLYYNRRLRREASPFVMAPSTLGGRARRLGEHADRDLAPAMFAALSIDYLRRFEDTADIRGGTHVRGA